MTSIDTGVIVPMVAVGHGGAPADEGQKRIDDATHFRHREDVTMGDQRMVLLSANWKMHLNHVEPIARMVGGWPVCSSAPKLHVPLGDRAALCPRRLAPHRHR